ncbi:hypothetical protein [Hyphomicrobium sp.]|uniref:hypothetical protein n=1 Tax=Hyphomicrobium sp. TaxID=82 RepID=UPI002FDD3E29
MLARFQRYPTDALAVLKRHWLTLLAALVIGGWIWFAFWLSDVQGRMDLPRAYSVRMTCEDDPEADLWRGGCERIRADIDTSGRPGFFDLYRAFVRVHHAPGPRAAAAARFAETKIEADFDVTPLLTGQRYGLAAVTPEFDGVKNTAHAEAVKDEIDARDRALLVIGRAGLGMDALVAGALANLVHPGAMVEGAAQYAAVLAGQAKTSDLATGMTKSR